MTAAGKHAAEQQGKHRIGPCAARASDNQENREAAAMSACNCKRRLRVDVVSMAAELVMRAGDQPGLRGFRVVSAWIGDQLAQRWCVATSSHKQPQADMGLDKLPGSLGS
jgi:hypothetical protein